MRKLLILFAFLAIATVGVLPVAAQDGDAQLRVAHLSVDAGEVDVYADGNVVLTNFEFGTVSDWLTLPAGTYSLAVAPAGTSVDEAVVGPLDVTLEDDSWYTVAAIGLAGDETLTAQIIEENYSDITAGETRLTIVHAIPNAQPVTVTADDNVLTAGLAYPGAGNDGVAIIDNVLADTYDLQVYLTDGPDTVLFDLPGTELVQNRNYFIAATGLESNPELVLASTNPMDVGSVDMADTAEETADDDAQLRVGHLAPDAPAVDVYINGELSAFTGIEYPAVSSWTTVPAGTYSVAVAPAGTSLDDAVIGPLDVTLDGGGWFTVAAIGLLADETLTAQVLEEDLSGIPDGETRFTVLHAVPGAPAVDVFVDSEPFVRALAFPGTLDSNDGASTFTVLEGDYNIRIRPAGDPYTVLVDVPNFSMESGNNYLIAAINPPSSIDAFVATTLEDEIVSLTDSTE